MEGFQESRTQTELRSFLGLCNAYRRFVPNFARTAAPLNALHKKGCPGDLQKFNDEQSKAFELLKQALISPPVLRLPKPGFRSRLTRMLATTRLVARFYKSASMARVIRSASGDDL